MTPFPTLTTDRETARHSPKGDYTDYALMLALWRSGSAECRDVALDMADRDREASRPDPQPAGLMAA